MIETSRSVLVAAKRKGKRKRVNVVVRTKTKIKYNKKIIVYICTFLNSSFFA